MYNVFTKIDELSSNPKISKANKQVEMKCSKLMVSFVQPSTKNLIHNLKICCQSFYFFRFKKYLASASTDGSFEV